MNNPQSSPTSLFDAEPPHRIRRSSSKSQIRILIIVVLSLAVLITLTALLLSTPGQIASISTYKTAIVEQNSWTDLLELSGVVELSSSRAISSPEKARITAVLVEAGDMVKVGQVLATFDTSDLDSQLTSLSRSKASRARDLERLDLEYSFSQRSASSNRVSLVRDLESSRKNANLQRELHEAGSTSAEELNNAELKVIQAEEALNKADLQAEQNSALYNLNRKNSLAEMDSAQESINELSERISTCTVRSTINGRVMEIATVAREIGAVINQYTTIMTVANTGSPLVKAKLPDASAAKVTKGMAVSLIMDSGTFEGTVERVGVIANTDDSTFGTYVDLYIKPPQGIELMSGSSASVRLSLGQRDQVLQVARGAWYSGSSQDYVYLIQGNTAVKTKVSLGSASTKMVEVQTGLNPGDTIISSSYAAFVANDSVQLQGARK